MGAQKIHVKFQKNCKNTGKILKISCVRCNEKFDIIFVTSHKKFSLVLLQMTSYILKNVKKERNRV